MGLLDVWNFRYVWGSGRIGAFLFIESSQTYQKSSFSVMSPLNIKAAGFWFELQDMEIVQPYFQFIFHKILTWLVWFVICLDVILSHIVITLFWNEKNLRGRTVQWPICNIEHWENFMHLWCLWGTRPTLWGKVTNYLMDKHQARNLRIIEFHIKGFWGPVICLVSVLQGSSGHLLKYLAVRVSDVSLF